MSELAARQAALVRALVSGGPVPDGFDTGRVTLAARALMRKRARGVASHWPALGAMPGFDQGFAAWAADHEPAGSHEEGIAYARSLGRELSPAARAEQVMAGKGHFARENGGVVVRVPVIGVRRFGLR